MLRDNLESANKMKAELGGLLLEAEMRRNKDSAEKKRDNVL